MITCHECGNNNNDTDEYCGDCGTRLIGSKPIPKPAVQSAMSPSPKNKVDEGVKEVFTSKTFKGFIGFNIVAFILVPCCALTFIFWLAWKMLTRQ